MHTSNIVAAYVLTVHDQLREAMRHVDLEPRELAALTLVAEHDGCSLDWLRARVDLTQSGTVRLVDRLAARDLLRRGASSGRSVPLHVTDHGIDSLDRWRTERDRVADDLLAAVAPELRSLLVDAMAVALAGQQRRRPQADATCRTCSWTACGRDCPVDRSVASPAPGDES
jgi:DNA-binding MarR family transcriptional regulator